MPATTHETHGSSTFFWKDGRLVGCYTVLGDCVFVAGRGKGATIPIDVWREIVEHESSRT